MALRDNLLGLSESHVLTCENKDNNMVWIKMRQFQERAWDCGHSMSPHKANSWITVFLDKRKKSEGNMPLLSVTSSSEDGRGGICPAPLLLCRLLQGKSAPCGYHRPQSLKNLFLSVPPLNQSRPICVLPKTKLQSLQDTALQKTLPRLGL